MAISEDIKILKDVVKNAYEDIELKNNVPCEVLAGEEIKAIENVLNRLEQDEKVIEEMAEVICTNTPPFKKCKTCIIDYFRKKCE